MSYSQGYPLPPMDAKMRCPSCAHCKALPNEPSPWNLECVRPRHPRGLVTADWGCLDHETPNRLAETHGA